MQRLVMGIAWALAALGTTAASAQDPFTPPEGWVFEQNLSYGEQSPAQRLDLLHPASPGKALPAVIHIHGGGWQMGNRGGESTFALMRRLAERGMVGVDIDYRLSGEALFPAAIEDCKLAVRWLRAHASEYGVDSQRIGAMGASAGGHLSALLAVTGGEADLEGSGGYAGFSSTIQAAAPVCPPLDFMLPLSDKFGMDDPLVNSFLGGTPAALPEVARKASPRSYVRPALPPLFLVHGTADKRVLARHSEEMAAALRAVGAPCELHLVEGGGHGMGIAREEPMATRMVEFFERTLEASVERDPQP